jgi:hypothetical protein
LMEKASRLRRYLFDSPRRRKKQAPRAVKAARALAQ